MESRIIARGILNENYKQIMSAFSSIYTQLEFDSQAEDSRLRQISAYYTVVFFKAKSLAPIVSHIDAYMANNSEISLTEDDQNLAAEILIENHIHELKTEGLIEVEVNENGLHVISLTEKGKIESRSKGKDIRLI
jgi:calcineurin-like phosphoesterase family protein